MTSSDEHAADELMRRVGEALERRDDDLALQSEPFLAWLAADLRAGLSHSERRTDERDADAFARETHMTRLAVRRVERAMPSARAA